MAERKRTRRRFWRLVLGVYLLALAASVGWQLLRPSDPADTEMSRVALPVISTSGARLNRTLDVTYSDVGEGEETIVLVHGSPGSASNFDQLIPLLAPDHRVIAVDLPGFGGSAGYLPDYGIDIHAEYLSEFCNALAIDRAHFVGFSLGSGPILHLASADPERVQTITMLAAIGIQEGEGSGDYAFEHLKYVVGYAGIVVLPEIVPHFGAFSSLRARHSFIRNFFDTDQRPLRGILESLEQPVLILHGEGDFLVPPWVAVAHHDIVEHSQLVMMDTDHFLLFRGRDVPLVAEEISNFVTRATGGSPPERRTINPFDIRMPGDTKLPGGFNLRHGTSPWAQAWAIVIATYILEDPTTIITGVLIKEGHLDWFVGVFAIFFGILSGDIGLYLIGFIVGRRILKWNAVASRLPTRHMDALGQWFDTHGWSAVLASRFVPGSRFPLYISAGALGKKPFRFALWTMLAVFIWTPVMLLIVILLGDAAMSPFRAIFGDSWLSIIVGVLVLIVLIRVIVLAATKVGRYRLLASVQRVWRWEFWPMWIFYLPLVPWLLWLALRHRSLTAFTATNPCMPAGGVVGESKAEILSKLPTDLTCQAELIPAESVENRLERFRAILSERTFDYPLVLKPDAGERGAGVRLVNDLHEAREAFEEISEPLIAQQYHPGPLEAGVFYIREPGSTKGRIFSVTDKHFSEIVGDGRHTLRELIWRHPRYRMQARVFLRRFVDRQDVVLGEGERLRLAEAGNHCQGTQFKDGLHLVTPALSESIDAIAKAIVGFHFGRFDVRYKETEAFKAGHGFQIIELNGVSSESTNIYDPDRGLIAAYRTLYRQWALAFSIGAANRARGVTPVRLRTLLAGLWKHRRRRVDPIAD